MVVSHAEEEDLHQYSYKHCRLNPAYTALSNTSDEESFQGAAAWMPSTTTTREAALPKWNDAGKLFRVLQL